MVTAFGCKGSKVLLLRHGSTSLALQAGHAPPLNPRRQRHQLTNPHPRDLHLPKPRRLYRSLGPHHAPRNPSCKKDHLRNKRLHSRHRTAIHLQNRPRPRHLLTHRAHRPLQGLAAHALVLAPLRPRPLRLHDPAPAGQVHHHRRRKRPLLARPVALVRRHGR